MHPLQSHIIRELGARASIDPAVEIARRVDFLVGYAKHSGAKGFVLGISGGQDSSLAGRLCQLAAEQIRVDEGVARFVAVRLPYRAQADEADAQLALEFIRPDEVVNFNIDGGVDGIANEFAAAAGASLSDFTKGNVKARMRMVAQYALAGEHGLLVVGTDHAAEAVTGFFTKFGDGGADVLPLSGLTKRQGAQLLQALDAPPRLYEKVPTADLLDEQPGQSDEANLGIRYQAIDDYLEGKAIDPDVAAALEARYMATRHKRTVPVGPDDTWWLS